MVGRIDQTTTDAGSNVTRPKFTIGPSSAGPDLSAFGTRITDLYALDKQPEPVAFDIDQVNLPASRRFLGDEHAGIQFVGWYGSSRKEAEPIASILYHKITAKRRLETLRRLVIWQATGYGQFGTDDDPAHIGQPDALYINGANFGHADPDDPTKYTLKPGVDHKVTLTGNNFSFDCISGHYSNLTLLANHPSQLQEMEMTWPELEALGVSAYAAAMAGIEVPQAKIEDIK